MKPVGVAILSAAAYLAFRLMVYIAQAQLNLFYNFPPFLPLIGFVFIGIVYVMIQYHRTAPAGMYNWLEGFKAGGKVALLAGLIAAAGTYMYYTFIDTEFLELLSIEKYNEAKAQGWPEESLQKYYEFQKGINKAGIRSTLLLSGTTALGLLASLIVSWLVKTVLPAPNVRNN